MLKIGLVLYYFMIFEHKMLASPRLVIWPAISDISALRSAQGWGHARECFFEFSLLYILFRVLLHPEIHHIIYKTYA